MHAGIAAYDHQERVQRYDRDMDLMHPNRPLMAEMVTNVLAAGARPPELVIDLGTGSGFLLERILRRFPGARAVGIDGAAHMLALAASRLGPLADRVDFRTGDFRDLRRICEDLPRPADAIVSSFALHHLNGREKAALVQQAAPLLAEGGWFLNADLVRQPDDLLEEMVQTLRVRGILQRSDGTDPRFRSDEGLRQYLLAMEREEGDQPQPLEEDLAAWRAAGLAHVGVFWVETREAVFGGMRAADPTSDR